MAYNNNIYIYIYIYIYITDINYINALTRMECVEPAITLFESMELLITISLITSRLSVVYPMPPVKSNNDLKQGTFCNSLHDYLEKLSCMNGNIVIVDVFNICWFDTNGSEHKQFCNIIENFEQKHTESIIYLTIFSLERIVILYQSSPSHTYPFPIIEYFRFHCIVYVLTQFGNR